MQRFYILSGSILTSLIIFGSLFVFTASAKDNTGGLSRSEVEQVIEEYILDNPEIIEQAIIALNEKRQLEKEANIKANLEANTETLLAADAAFVLGDPNAPITVIEFFDYQCGYCKRSIDEITSLVDEYDGKVRVILKELPILSEASRNAARAALAAAKQEKYADMHVALMKHRGQLTPSVVNTIAFNLGIDVERLEADAKSEAIEAQIEESLELAKLIGVNGTPAFIVGTEFIPGADLGRVRTAIEAEIETNKL